MQASKSDMRRTDAVSAALKQRSAEYQQLTALDAMIEDLTLNRPLKPRGQDGGKPGGTGRPTRGIKRLIDDLFGGPSEEEDPDELALDSMMPGTARLPDADTAMPRRAPGMPKRPGKKYKPPLPDKTRRQRRRQATMIVLQIWLVMMLIGALFYLRGLL